ncbi:hypothetical protein FF1_035370 [Malus domestica]
MSEWSHTISQLKVTRLELTIEWELTLIVTNPNDKNDINVYFHDRLLATLLYYDNLMMVTKSLPPLFP